MIDNQERPDFIDPDTWERWRRLPRKALRRAMRAEIDRIRKDEAQLDARIAELEQQLAILRLVEDSGQYGLGGDAATKGCGRPSDGAERLG
jgi:hypothetical protein